MLNRWVAAKYLNSNTVYYVKVDDICWNGIHGKYYGHNSKGWGKWGNAGLWMLEKIEYAKIVRNKRLLKKLEKLEKNT